MSRPETANSQTPSVEQWCFDNLQLIAQVMEAKQAEKLKRFGIKPWTPPTYYDYFRSHFNTEQRWLSEMPICDMWNEISAPEGFSIVNGFVNFPIHVESGEISHSWDQHIFAIKNDIVICFTSGQFVKFPAESGPGSRIKHLLEKAPHNIRILDPDKGIAVLHGSADDIFERTGIRYQSK